MVHERHAFRARVLASFAPSGLAVDELLAFNENESIDPERIGQVPLAPELHVAAWAAYAAEATHRGAWEVLRARLVQLQFPVREGISQTEAYRAATRRGMLPEACGAAGLDLQAPDTLRLWVHDSVAGPIPVLCTADRDDFVRLVQALSCRNEPQPVPASMGACIVSGFNNWDRIRQYRERWAAQGSLRHSPELWAEEFRQLIPKKELYQDRFLILSEAPYSNVSAREMGLAPEEWRRLSLTIRLEHESTHYLTLRLFSSMRNHPLDELIADYAGITAACGAYRADWFLRFVGLEAFPHYRQGGRLENYRGSPALSDAAFQVLQALVKAAAENLARLDARRPSPQGLWEKARRLGTLFQGTLEELASEEAEALFRFGED